MKRRITLSIVGTVAATLILAGVGTLIFARIGARKAAEEEVRNQAEATADLVAASRRGLARVSEQDIKFLVTEFCNERPAKDAPLVVQRVRDDLCAHEETAGQASVTLNRDRLCNDIASRLIRNLGTDLENKRKQFCDNPTADTLDQFQVGYCYADISGVPVAIRRQVTQTRRFLCLSSTRQSQQSATIQETLSKESIGYVSIASDGSIVDGSLPKGLQVSEVDVVKLRAGETVSGEFGSRVYAAAAVDVTNDPLLPLEAIVIDRAANPIRETVQWFLMASGLTLLIGLLVAARLSKKLTQPLHEATVATGHIAAGDLSTRLPEHPDRARRRRDELDELAGSINSMAAALERSRGLEQQFLMSVSHDLRTPLTSIRGYAEAVSDGAAPDPKQAASVILAESRRLERLVRDLLDLAKLDARQFALHIADIDLGELATRSAEGFRRQAEEAGLQLRLDTGGAPCHVRADPDRLQQVIANLVENALKYATTSIRMTVTPDATAPRLVVADDGPGIAAEDLPHVFERLYVAKHEPKRKEVGSGLGLAIVRELVDAMNGSVHAEPEPGGGTRIVVTLTNPSAGSTPGSNAFGRHAASGGNG